jgi:tetraacyldisaccharide 4'-kinase
MIAFAGIGRPQKFFDMLASNGAGVLEAHGFGDHHRFTSGEIADLRARAERSSALLVTTEKDFVRLSLQDRAGVIAIPVTAEFKEPATLSPLLAKLAPAAKAQAV